MRRPVRASGRQTFPSLATLSAGGVLAVGCHSPECGDSRSAELQAHTDGVSRALARGRVGEALHEASVGVGASAHHASPPMTPSGGIRPVTHAPPTVTPVPLPAQPVPVALDEVVADGQMRAVGPQPPATPVVRPARAPLHSIRHGGRPVRVTAGNDVL